jgi:conjugal transfer pilus assembly protein TraV
MDKNRDERAQWAIAPRRVLAMGVLAGAIVVTGCTDMAAVGGSSKFGCKAPDGVHCMSVSGVYANAIQNNLPGQQSGQKNDAPPSAKSPAARGTSLSPAVYRISPEADGAVPLRSQARVLRLWVKPWETDTGDLVDQGFIFVTVNDGEWLVENRNQVIRKAYAVSARKPSVSGEASMPPSPSGESKTPSANALTPTAVPIVPVSGQAAQPPSTPAIPKETFGRLTDALKAAQAQQRRYLETEGVESDVK